MIGRVKRKITSKISNILRSAVRSEIENALPIIPQLIEFQNSPKESRQSYYQKDPLADLDYYQKLKERLLTLNISVEEATVDISDFEDWLKKFPAILKAYQGMGNAVIEKCMEHYLTYKTLRISKDDVYIDIAAAGSPWAEVLNSRTEDKKTEDRNQRTEDRRQRVRAYRLDLSYPDGIKGINIGADAGNTKLPDNFASVLSLQCAYECLMGDADVLFIKEASRILNEKGRFAIIPLYLKDTYINVTSPYCDQQKIIIDPEAKKVWRDDEYKVPFSRNYSPESFANRIYSRIPDGMEGKVLYFKNLAEVMKHYPGQRIYCFFMFLCEK